MFNKRWCGVAVRTAVFWPTKPTTVQFDGRELTLRPQDSLHRPSLEIDFDSTLSWEDAHTILRRYLSALAWSEGFPIEELFFLGGGRRIGFGNGQLAHHYTDHFVDRLPAPPADPRAVLAMSLYREALVVNSLPYQVLGFFKILNIVHAGSKSQKKWIASALPSLPGHEVAKRVAELGKLHSDVPEYLYSSCRCAVAHANTKPIADPDLVADDNRLRADLPVIRALAEHMMSVDLGIKR